MTDENDSVRITMRDIYREQQEMKSLLEKLANSLPSTENIIDDHEKRLRALETRIGWAVGAIGIVAAVMPWVVSIIR